MGNDTAANTQASGRAYLTTAYARPVEKKTSSSCQHREIVLLLHLFGHLIFSLELWVHDCHEVFRNLGIRDLKNLAGSCRIQLQHCPNKILVGRSLPTIEDEPGP